MRVMEWDSAGACKAVIGSKTAAAVASKEAAAANGLEVIKDNISNLGGLSTRYILVKKGESAVPAGKKPKSSLAVLLQNEPMALMKLVSAFALRGLNITKLESQPACHVKNDMFSGRHFDDLFFIDFEPKVGSLPCALRLTCNHNCTTNPNPESIVKGEASTQAVVANIREFAQSVRCLGTYGKHVALEDISHTEMPWTAYI